MVMAGLVPAIHEHVAPKRPEDVDGRDARGHDESDISVRGGREAPTTRHEVGAGIRFDSQDAQPEQTT